MIKRVAVLLSLVVFATVAFANVGAPRGFAKKLYDATFALYLTQGKKSTFICTATAFERAPGGYHLLSAGHCVEGVPTTMSFAVAEEIGGTLTPVNIVRARDTEEVDFSSFYLQTTKHYPVIPLGNENESYVGDKTVDASFSMGLGKQIITGQVVSEVLGNSNDCSDCAGRYLVQMLASSGSSGSAVVSLSSKRIIGVHVGDFRALESVAVEQISLYKKFLTLPDQQSEIRPDGTLLVPFQLFPEAN